MSLGWVIAGTCAQLMLAFMLFMLAVFAGGGFANGRNLSKRQTLILDVSMIALPLSAVVSALVVIYLYRTGADASGYAWYALPVACVALYLVFTSQLKHHS